QPWAAPEITDFGRGTQPFEGYFFNYDRLQWSISSPEVRTFGSQSAEGFYGSEFDTDGLTFETNDLDSSAFDTDLSWGHRYEFGYVRDRKGWQFSGFFGFNDIQNFVTDDAVVLFDDPEGLLAGFQDDDDDGIDDDLNNNNIYGRDGEDLGSFVNGVFVFGADDPTAFDGIPDDLTVDTDLDDGFLFVPRFEEFNARQETTLSGIELMRVHRLRQQPGRGLFELLYGVRFVRLKDRLNVSLEGGELEDTEWSTVVDNVVVGPQIGGRWVHRYGRFRMALEGRFLAGFNVQQGKQHGIIADDADGDGDLDQLFATSFNNSYNEREWSPTSEFRANLSYQVSKAVNIRAGWTALYMDGIGRAVGVQTYTLPTLGLDATNNREDVFIQGLNFGIEINH
ncbi:MAG: BBP7 family outer membrane beta-barrel protein, partial [Pirellulales bacterium]|nr:BBP7 family outer membrane beta-barrel protein [Pirellulales bacterium]